MQTTVLEHSANANTTLEYKGNHKIGPVPKWVKEKQIEAYYKSMDEYYSECLAELKVPERFDITILLQRLLNSLREFLEKDEDFTSLISRIAQNHPYYGMDNRAAGEYLIGLNNLTLRVATSGQKLNQEIACNALRFNAPFTTFSDLYLGNYTISYFHEYKVRMSKEHFRLNHFLVRERPKLVKRKRAMQNYFDILTPREELSKVLLKEQFKLWLYIALSDFANSTDFPNNPTDQPYEINSLHLSELHSKQTKALEELRHCLYDADDSIFVTADANLHEPTATLWKNLVLIGLNR
jgi:hypothetical protein